MISLKEVQKKSFEEKYETFMDICQNFQPVFRYFCMEKFLDPAVWFEKRLAYTRSVATSSIGNLVHHITYRTLQLYELQGDDGSNKLLAKLSSSLDQWVTPKL